MDKTKPCKVLRAKSEIGIVIKIMLIWQGEVSIFYALEQIMPDYAEKVNAGDICVAYLIRIIGIVAGSFILKKVKKRENDLWASFGINALAGIVDMFVLWGTIAGEELGKMIIYSTDETVEMICMLVLYGATVAIFPAFCSVALFDWRESARIKKRKKKGIYIPTAKKLDI